MQAQFDDCYDGGVLALAALGIVKGTSEQRFSPDQTLTRQQAATILARMVDLLYIPAGEAGTFQDEDAIASWAKQAAGVVSGVALPDGSGTLMQGTAQGRFLPEQTLTVEQAAALALRLQSCAGDRTSNYPEGASVVGYNGQATVLQLPSRTGTSIVCINCKDGATTASFTVSADIDTEDAANWRTLDHARPGTFRGTDHMDLFGEAGYYVLFGTELTQITDQPVLDVYGYGSILVEAVILTHEPGIRLSGMNALGGNQIAVLHADGTQSTYVSSLFGRTIAGFEQGGDYHTIRFYTGADVGMQHFNQYRYICLGPDKLLCTGYEAGRPEMMEMPQEGYVQAENARLIQLGLYTN